MSEKELLKLGFTREESMDEIDIEHGFYYYVKDICDGLTFITNANNETEKDSWFVEFFNTEVPVRYYEFSTVKKLLALIEEGITKDEGDE
tara:strand:- start:231 stop:500 length:270 start_codon:yes stop_codon:yes gene_type:complete